MGQGDRTQEVMMSGVSRHHSKLKNHYDLGTIGQGLYGLPMRITLSGMNLLPVTYYPIVLESIPSPDHQGDGESKHNQ